MGKRMVLFVAVALAAAMIIPAVAFALPTNPGLTNDYGQHFAGQDNCLTCHTSAYSDTVHGRFTKAGLVPAPPVGWTVFQSLGGGPSYNILGNTWLTLGASADAGADEAGAPSEILIWKGPVSTGAMPWNLIEGLSADPATGEYKIPAEPLSDGPYGCYQCHNLGPTKPGTGFLTASKGWSRPVGTTAADFAATPAVSSSGMSIQCESCHGTGVAADVDGHFNSGTKLSAGNPDASFNIEVLGNSQVCGACHASYTQTDPQGNPTLGIFGYTPDKRLADVVNVSGTPAGRAPYTKIPTEAEFLASPLAYSMFPNGDNATGHHFYYNEWQASAHSWRGALTPDSVDASAYQKLGASHFSNSFDPTLSSGCYKCHTGEGYLTSKNTTVAKFMPSPAPSNVGFMGQECITCHTGHPAGTDPANVGVMRAPDPAGVRSNTGRMTANASICEDCHNWQYETQGLATPGSAGFTYAPVADLAAHASPSHPQRETLEGRSMVEIPQASEFMPNAKCEDCHMPVTNSENNRFAHGMKPMLPGDAKAWNAAANAASVAAGNAAVYNGKDSCSTCHAGATLGELQANIDTWQAEATAQAKKAATAITAAQKRKEYSLTNKKKPGYTLVGKATWNYEVFVNDSSSGVHNPQYIVAGLRKAQQLAKSVGGSFKSFSVPRMVKRGRRAFASGTVVNGDRSAAAGAKVVLYRNGKATKQVSVTDAHGAFAFSFRPRVKARYSVVWQRASNRVTRLKSASVTVKVVH